MQSHQQKQVSKVGNERKEHVEQKHMIDAVGTEVGNEKTGRAEWKGEQKLERTTDRRSGGKQDR